MLDLVSGCACNRFCIGPLQAFDEVVQDVAPKSPPIKRGNLVKRGGGPRKAWVERLVVIGDGHISYYNKGQESIKVHVALESELCTILST